ncbi:phosphatidylinositol 4-phosphate 3-kinase C2 domain-containing subunit alpha-like, partial [Elysia marginata]
MASDKGRESPIQGLRPPPVAAPRNRRSPLSYSRSTGGNASSEPIPEGRQPPPIPPRPQSHPASVDGEKNGRGVNTNGNRGLMKSNSMYTKDNLESSQLHSGDHRNSLPEGKAVPFFHPDLEGVNFSKSTPSPTLPEVKYPDISHAFRELKNSSTVPSRPPPPPPTYNMRPSAVSANGATVMQQMHAVGIPMYPNISQNHGSQALWNNPNFPGSVSGAGTPSMPPAAYHYHQTGYRPPSGSYGMNILPYPPYSNSGPPAQAEGSGSRFYPQNSQHNFAGPQAQGCNYLSAAYDSKPLAFNAFTPSQSVLPYNNSAVFPPAPNTYDSENPIVVAGFGEGSVSPPPDVDGSRDLINLGFPEKEYLSLSQFDPLYSRGRKESVSVLDDDRPSTERRGSEISFSFGEAFPNVRQNSHSPEASSAYGSHNDESIWTIAPGKPKHTHEFSGPIGFEAFDFDAHGHSKFGCSEEEFMNIGAGDATGFVSPAYDTPAAKTSRKSSKSRKSPEIPPRPPSWITPESKRYEHLRKRTFIDAESESFCQMVADLKKKYQSSDEKTNQGYLVNQMRECHISAIQIKVTVHTMLTPEPVIFTCNTNALVEHVISHVLYTVSPGETQVNTNNFVLKVFDRTEYLCNDLPLAKFDYTQTCLKMDEDIVLELIKIEDVVRPFMRTHDDDMQMLYFPKEYINADGTALSQDALGVFLETFYHEVEALLQHFSKADAGSYRTQGVLQTTKAICVNLARVETVEISKAIDLVQKCVAELLNPSSSSQQLFGSSETQDKDTQDAIKFDTYKMVCSLYHGTKRIIPDISTSLKPLTTGLCERIYWDEWLQFDNTFLCTLPRESRLCLMLCGVKTSAATGKAPGPADKGDKAGNVADSGQVTEGNKIIMPLGAAAVQLFNEKGYLNQGPQLVPLLMGAKSDPIMPSCKTLLPDAVLLQLSLPDFERTIFFPEPLNSPESPSRSFDDLTPKIRTLVQRVMEKDSCATLDAEELEMLWTHRHYMRDHPHLLPRILQAAHSWDWATLSEIYSLLRSWKSLHPMQAFELLLPQFPDLRVRQFAADSLNKIPSDELVDFLPQMIQSCSYFTSNAFPLKLVFKNSNPKADAHYVIYKVGDDLRQDMLTMQMVRIMESLWLQQGLDLKMITFACLATGPKKGIIELITESETLRKIQGFGGVTGSFKDRLIKEWLQKNNPTELEYKKAVENFTASCAGYCVATYVLGVGDRHNDNIMLKQSGHMFHIDFGKFLGDSQMFGNFKRDRVPFVLTSDMAYVINDGGKQGHRFQHFVDLCCQAFNILRRHADLFRSLFILMARSGIPGVTERAVQYVQTALLPGLSEAQATATFT